MSIWGPWDRSGAGQWPMYESRSEVRTETRKQLPQRARDMDQTQVLPKVPTDELARLQRRVKQLETKYQQAIEDRVSTHGNADWALFAMVVSVLCALLSVAVLFSVLFLSQ